MKYVINSTNTNQTYAFFLPIVNILWKEIGYQPLSLLVGNPEEYQQNDTIKHIHQHIQKTSQTHYIPKIPKISDTTTSQTCRLYAAALPNIQENDYLLTSDADMLPLNKEYFHTQDWTKPIHILSSDAYGPTTPKYPICYLGANANIWKEIMNIKGTIQQTMTQNVKIDNWEHDEILFYRQLNQSKHHTQTQYLKRGWTNGIAHHRMDRANWNWQNQKDLIDSHSLRPGPTHWNQIWPLITAYTNTTQQNQIQNYIKGLI